MFSGIWKKLTTEHEQQLSAAATTNAHKRLQQKVKEANQCNLWLSATCATDSLKSSCLRTQVAAEKAERIKSKKKAGN